MIEVTFYSEGSRLTGFTVQGHSGLADPGEDVLCAAVTSAVRLAECAVNDVLGLEAAVKVKEKDAAISLKLSGGLVIPSNRSVAPSAHASSPQMPAHLPSA